MKKRREKIIFAIVIIIFLSFSYLIFKKLNLSGTIQSIGVYNYLLIFSMSVFGSNFLTASFFYPILFLMKSAGLNIFSMAFFAAVGGAIGDTLFLVFGRKVGENLENKSQKIFQFFKKNRNNPYIYLFITLYASFFPASNEIMTFALGYFKYPVKKVIIPLIIGNTIYYTLLIYLGGSLFEILL